MNRYVLALLLALGLAGGVYAATDLANQSTTAGSNTSVGGVSIAEGMSPSGVNDGMRAIIAQAKGALLAVTSSGTNTITATYAPTPDAYVSGWLYPFKAGGTSTSTATFNANSLGAKDVKVILSAGKTALRGGEIVSGGFYILQYDGTDMVLLNPTPQEANWPGGPSITATTPGTPTYSNNVGNYIRIGNVVHAWGFLQLSNWTGSPSGDVTITQLPFAATNTTAFVQACTVGRASGFNLSAGYTQIAANISPNTTSIRLFEIGDNVADQQIQASQVSTTAALSVACIYRVGS